MDGPFRSNVFANTVGKIWAALLSLLLIPVTVRLLGVESYGLIGFLVTLQALVGFLDFGMGAAFTRELARLSVSEDSASMQRTLFRSLELIYWSLGAATAIAISLGARFLATRWLNARHLTPSTLTHSIVLMGLMVGAQFPYGLYQGGLIGLQRQVLNNVILGITNTIQKIGAIAVIIYLAPRIEYFLLWYVIIAFAGVIACRIALNHSLAPCASAVRFSMIAVRSVWRYAAGWAGNTIGTTLAGQADKIVLSRALPLEALGYYTLAQTVASFLWMLVSPISTAIFPRFVHLLAKGDDAGLAKEYHIGNQLVACLVLPVAGVIAFSPFDVMFLWTRSISLANHTYIPAAFFAAGMALAGMQYVAFNVLLASGEFRKTLAITLLCGVGGLPFLIFAALRYGVIAAAAVAALQLAALLITIPILHQSMLRGQLARTIRVDFGMPLLATISIGMVTYFLRPSGAGYLPTILYLFASWALTFAACVAAAPEARSILRPHHVGSPNATTQGGAVLP
jgi:O-antigen/teichoic acid export membrane protein